MHKADYLPPSCAVVTKSGSLNFLEPSGPVQACNGTALLLPFYLSVGIELFHANGRTERHDEAVTFRNFAKAPKNPSYAVLLKCFSVHLAKLMPTRGTGSRYKLSDPGGLDGPPEPEYFAYILVLIFICRLYKLKHSDEAHVTLKLRAFPI